MSLFLMLCRRRCRCRLLLFCRSLVRRVRRGRRRRLFLVPSEVPSNVVGTLMAVRVYRSSSMWKKRFSRSLSSRCFAVRLCTCAGCRSRSYFVSNHGRFSCLSANSHAACSAPDGTYTALRSAMYEWLVWSLRISLVRFHARPQSVVGRWPWSHSWNPRGL